MITLREHMITQLESQQAKLVELASLLKSANTPKTVALDKMHDLLYREENIIDHNLRSLGLKSTDIDTSDFRAIQAETFKRCACVYNGCQ